MSAMGDYCRDTHRLLDIYIYYHSLSLANQITLKTCPLIQFSEPKNASHHSSITFHINNTSISIHITNSKFYQNLNPQIKQS